MYNDNERITYTFNKSLLILISNASEFIYENDDEKQLRICDYRFFRLCFDMITIENK